LPLLPGDTGRCRPVSAGARFFEESSMEAGLIFAIMEDGMKYMLM
jgi:hypothetical protein